MPQNLDSPAYLRHLRQTVPIIYEEAPLAVRDRIMYQHDGATAHSTNIVRDYLNRTFNNRLIARVRGDEYNVAIPWPARSPDLTPLDFFCGPV